MPARWYWHLCTGVTVLCPTGKLALVCAAKPVLFNHLEPYQKFRKFLFQETYVEKVYNFSVLRNASKKQGGRNLFDSATSPISVIFYTKQIPAMPAKKLMYCAPKTTIKNRIIDGIAIDATDIKYLPRKECQKPGTNIWKVAMWGTEQDFDIIQRLYTTSTLEKFFIENKWNSRGVGFKISDPSDKPNDQIKNKPYLPTSKIQRYFSAKNLTELIENVEFHRLGSLSAYSAPHILIKRGFSNKQFCASYIDYDCSFKDAVYGIYNKNKDKLKILTAYLNSSFVKYLMFLSSASWGVEGEEVKPNEVFKLPDLCFSLPNETSQSIIQYFDQIIEVKKANLLQSQEDQKIAELEKSIDAVFWNAFNLSEVERIHVEDLLDYSLGAFMEKGKSEAFKPVSNANQQAYAQYMCRTLNEFLVSPESDEFNVWATVVNVQGKSPLNVMVVNFNDEQPTGHITAVPAKEITNVLKEIEAYTYQEYAESIYYRKSIRYYAEDKAYIIKPNEKRFWSRSMAINDANELIGDNLD